MKRNLRIALDFLLLLAGAGFLYFVVSESRSEDVSGVDSGSHAFYRIQLVTIGLYAGLMLSPWLIRRLEHRFHAYSLSVLWLVSIPVLWALAISYLLFRLYFQPMGAPFLSALNLMPLWVSIFYGAVLYGVSLVRQPLRWFWLWFLIEGYGVSWLWQDWKHGSMGYGWFDDFYRDIHRVLPIVASAVLFIFTVRAIIRVRGISWPPLRWLTVAGWSGVVLLFMMTPPNPERWSLEQLPYIQEAALLPDGSLVLEAKKTFMPMGMWEDTVLLARSPGEEKFRALRRHRHAEFNPESDLSPIGTGSRNLFSHEAPSWVPGLLGVESEEFLIHLPDGERKFLCRTTRSDAHLNFRSYCPVWLGPGNAWLTSVDEMDFHGLLANGKPLHVRSEKNCSPKIWSSADYFILLYFCNGNLNSAPSPAMIKRISWRTGEVEQFEKMLPWGRPLFDSPAGKSLLLSPFGHPDLPFAMMQLDQELEWKAISVSKEIESPVIGWDKDVPFFISSISLVKLVARERNMPEERFEFYLRDIIIHVVSGHWYFVYQERNNDYGSQLFELDPKLQWVRNIGPAEFRIEQLGGGSFRYVARISGVEWLTDSITFVEHGDFGQRVVQYFPQDGQRKILLAVPYRNESDYGPADLSGMM